MTCRCGEFKPVKLERQTIFKRIREGEEIRPTLDLVAVAARDRDKIARKIALSKRRHPTDRRARLFRCSVCGQAWQSGRVWGFGGECLFQVPPIEAAAWHDEPFVDPAELSDFVRAVRDFIRQNQDGETTRACPTSGCGRHSISWSRFCLLHHTEQLLRVGAIATMPPGRLFEPYEHVSDISKYLHSPQEPGYNFRDATP